MIRSGKSDCGEEWLHTSEPAKKGKGCFPTESAVCEEEGKSWHGVRGLITTLGYISKESLELTIGIFKAKNYYVSNLILHNIFL